MERIFLLGYMGAGKTTLGKILAKDKNLEFIDLDHFIEARYKKTISQIFEESGEQKFREIESSLLKEVSNFENVIISTGGGTPCFFDNIAYMNSCGKTIYLKTSPQSLAKRLNMTKSKRPLLKDKTEKELSDFIIAALQNREPYYNQSHMIFEVEDFDIQNDINKVISDLITQINIK